MIKLLIADDHPVVRRGLRQILAEAGDIHVASEVGSAQAVLEAVREQRFDVVVLDISLPGGNGIELIGEIRRQRPETRVLILTQHPEEQYAVRAIKAGAAGFLNKESAPEKLTEATRKIAAGGRWVSAELAETLASLFAGEAGGQPHERLSDREFSDLEAFGFGQNGVPGRAGAVPQREDDQHAPDPHSEKDEHEDECRADTLRGALRLGLVGLNPTPEGPQSDMRRAGPPIPSPGTNTHA